MSRSTARFDTLRQLQVGERHFHYHSLEALAEEYPHIRQFPYSLKVLLENLLRHADHEAVGDAQIRRFVAPERREAPDEIAFFPFRVLMQDFTGVPAIVDLAAMRDAMVQLGGDAARINPLSRVDLVIDHSVMVDRYGSADAFEFNMALEMQRNRERYEFLRWGQKAFDNFRVVPPGTGICHQVNLEYLGSVVAHTTAEDGTLWAVPDTLVGTDSHTTMINGLGVLGWGVGGIEAEAAMLGQPVSMLLPEVVGFRLEGKLREGTTATDLVLTITQMLRAHGVVGKFVEFYGPGLTAMTLPDRATIANMAPEYGATCGIFPIDEETIRYLRFTGRQSEDVELVEAYARAQGMWRDASTPEPRFSETLSLDLATVEPSLAGPKRPQDRVPLSSAAEMFERYLGESGVDPQRQIQVSGGGLSLHQGDVLIAAITSCTNTSNPSVMLAAGLLARNAVARGLKVAPHIRTSLAPGSQVVTDYLRKADLLDPLATLGFELVGYGCTTCIGNSGPLAPELADAVQEGDLVVCSVLSGNRNFEGRINPHLRANFLASPPLVVAYAIAGTLRADLLNDPIGRDAKNQPVYLRDIWPSQAEIAKAVGSSLTPEMFVARYADVFDGPAAWQKLKVEESTTYAWSDSSSYIQNPPYFTGMTREPEVTVDIVSARPLAVLGDSITTDHISPAGNIGSSSAAGTYLIGLGINEAEFNSFGSRRGNHQVMMRGTFGNVRLQNEMVPGTRGGFTRLMPDGGEMSIYDAAMAYAERGTPLVVVAGKEYGTGSSRDWAAKGTRLLGVRAVLAESYERIHRSNLVGMGVLPLQFPAGVTRKTLRLDGSETYTIAGLADLAPRTPMACTIIRADGSSDTLELQCRIDTDNELTYFRQGGILHYVLRHLLAQAR